jgi:hypothetical protein
MSPGFCVRKYRFHIRAPVISYDDSQRLPATAATTATTTAATSEASSTTATEAPTTASKASAATIEAAATETSTTRSHAGETTIAVAARTGSIESPGTTSEGVPVTRTCTARKITPADAIGATRTDTRATGAIRAADASCTIAGTCIPDTVA